MVCNFVKRLALALVSLAVTGCGSQGPTAGVPAMRQQTQHSSSATGAPLIYIANEHVKSGRFDHASLLGFPSDASGNVPPVVEIRGDATDMGRYGEALLSVAADKSGRLYAVGESPCDIGVWPAGSNGNVKYAAQFPVPCYYPGGPTISFVLDAQGDLWAASWEGDQKLDGDPWTSIIEYPAVPAGATGNIKLEPIRTIVGSKTGMHEVFGIALNGKGLVSVQATSGRHSAIFTFATSANGDVAPVSRLGGLKTKLGDAGYSGAMGIKYDSLGRLVACSNGSYPRLLTFAPGAHGNVAPVSTLFVPGCSGITLDSKDNIYVAFQDSILVYAAGAVGSAKPIRIISGNLTTLSSAYSIAF
jgi:hypothetical protein